jgi:hypothetical protein
VKSAKWLATTSCGFAAQVRCHNVSSDKEEIEEKVKGAGKSQKGPYLDLNQCKDTRPLKISLKISGVGAIFVNLNGQMWRSQE